MPARLGRYVVRRRIGSGGFATVWLAYDEQLDSPVAVKVLADNWTEDHPVRQRFLEEGRYLRKVESPHVVSVYDAGELDDGRPYLVMAYADQGTLADICLASQAAGAKFFGVYITPFPNFARVARTCEEIDAFARAHPLRQPGAPPM